MMYKKTTQIPNVLFDSYLQALTGAELKILLVILRQTNGWIDKRSGTRKKRDRLSYGQFIAKTGLSRRVVSVAIQKLIDKQLINVNCQSGKSMHLSTARRGNPILYYSSDLCTFQPRLAHFPTQTCAKSAHNKTNYTKLIKTKLSEPFNGVKSIGEIINKMSFNRNQTLLW